MTLSLGTFLALLAAVVVVSVVATRTGWSKEVIALLLGAALAPFHLRPIAGVHITPEFVMIWLLPLLLMPAAFKIAFSELRRVAGYVTLMASLAVLVAAAAGTLLFAWLLRLPPALAALPAVALAATDPISVIALLKRVGGPHRLGLMFELEALLNDATAAVVFRTALAMGGVVAAGHPGTEVEAGLAAVTQFGIATGGGILFGLATGLIASWVHRLINAPAAEVLLTVFLAFAAIYAETWHFSGVIAVVVAALVLGNVGRVHGMSPQTRVAVHHFWEAVEYGGVVLVFLLIGLELDREQVVQYLPAGLIAIGVSVVVRALSVYGVTGLYNLLSKDRVPLNYQHALTWGGLRGAVSLALVLSISDRLLLPGGTPAAPLLRVTVYAVVLFDILVQGTTMAPLLRRWRLVEGRRVDQALRHLLLRHSLAHAQLRQLGAEGVPATISAAARAELEEQLTEVEGQLDGLFRDHPELLGEARHRLQERLALAGLDHLAEQVTRDPENADAAERFYSRLYRDMGLE